MNVSTLTGLAIMIGTETATLLGVDLFRSWNTPIAWTGFILFADGIVWQACRNSWLRSARGEFVFLALVSIPLWLVFEFYNLFIENWYYAGLPEQLGLRLFGYAWAFATIWPAIFEGAELIDVWRRRGAAFPRESTPALSASTPALSASTPAISTPAMWVSVMVGTGMLVWPLVWPSPYLAAPVWLGFIFLFDPINARLGAESLVGDFRHGRYDRLKNLILSGFLCGGLWEFWNYWAAAKWHYTVPIMENLKIFEMPVPGYFGFPVFAIECFTMYVFVRTVLLGAATTRRPIGVSALSESR